MTSDVFADHHLVAWDIEHEKMLSAECACGATWRSWPANHPRPPERAIHSVEPLVHLHLCPLPDPSRATERVTAVDIVVAAVGAFFIALFCAVLLWELFSRTLR